MAKIKIGYIGNLYNIPEYIYHSDDFLLEYVIIEHNRMNDDMLTFLLVNNIKWIELKKDDALENIINNSGIKLWLVCSYGRKIRVNSVNDADLYNIHYAKLPYYKGRHPTFWATLAGEKNIGISLHRVAAEFDSGEIIAQKTVAYYLKDNESTIFEKLTEKVPELLNDMVAYLKGDRTNIKNNSEGHYYRPAIETDYTIDLKNDTYADIYNKVRCQSKYKGARLCLDGKNYWIKEVVFSKNPQEGVFKSIKLENGVYLNIKSGAKEK